jgi:hypothetical protein
LKLPFLKTRLKVCLFAGVRNHRPCLRLHAANRLLISRGKTLCKVIVLF